MKPPQFTDPDFPGRDEGTPERLGEDLRALSRASSRDLPSIDHTARALLRKAQRDGEEGMFMKMLRPFRMRPWLVTAVGVTAVAVVLLTVPISYTRTIGYEARVTVSDPLPGPAALDKIAHEFARALDSEETTVHAGVMSNRATVTARLPVTSRSNVEGVTRAFAAELADRGLTVESEVVPLTERVTGDVYALAANQILEIRVNSEGKSDAQIAEEIRAQLAEAGIENAFVDVEVGDNQMRIEMRMEKDGSEEPRPIRIAIDGMEPPEAGEGCCAVELQIDAEGKTPEEIEAEIRAQLEAMGIENPGDIEVRVDENGRVQVEIYQMDCCPDDPLKGAASSESETWGQVKERFR